MGGEWIRCEKKRMKKRWKKMKMMRLKKMKITHIEIASSQLLGGRSGG